MVKLCQCWLDLSQSWLGDDMTMDNITELKKSMQHTYHLRGHKTLDCWNIYLDTKYVFADMTMSMLTFISAFESSPVNCLKPCSWGKQWSPVNGATTAILRLCQYEIMIELNLNNYIFYQSCPKSRQQPCSSDKLWCMLSPTRLGDPWNIPRWVGEGCPVQWVDVYVHRENHLWMAMGC